MAEPGPSRPRRPPRRFSLEEVVSEFIFDSDSDFDPELLESDASSESDTDVEQLHGHVDVVDGWTSVDRAPTVLRFSGSPGVKLDIGTDSEPLDYFSKFVTDTFCELISSETNRYAEQCLRARQSEEDVDSRPHSRGRKWHGTTGQEIKRFLAVVFAMGLDRKPTLASYWSSDPVMSTPFFGSVMSRDRFLLLLRYFHVSDNMASSQSHVNITVPTDKLQKCRSVINHFNGVFKNVYYPEKDLSIDETMVPWTGRLSWKQYLPTKPNKYGMKMYQLCESSTGYTYNFKVYTGRDRAGGSTMSTHQLVMDLLQPVQGKGHCIWMDNFFNSVALSDELLTQGTGSCGTLRLSRKGIPKVIKETKLDLGESVHRRNGDILLVKWQDKKTVTFITTQHTADMVASNKCNPKTGNPIQQPNFKKDYDRNMNGVDISDQNVGYYSFNRKTMKWWKKLVFYLIDLARVQSYIVYCGHTSTRPVLTQLQFTKTLIRQLLQVSRCDSVILGRPSQGTPIARLTERHFPSLLPPTEKKLRPTKRCVVCTVNPGSKRRNGDAEPRRHETRFCCATCGVPLCVVPCFRLYHTYSDYRRAYVRENENEQ